MTGSWRRMTITMTQRAIAETNNMVFRVHHLRSLKKCKVDIHSKETIYLSPCKNMRKYRAPLRGGPQVAWMLQASWGRSGKQEQEQNSPNLVPAYYWSPVQYIKHRWIGEEKRNILLFIRANSLRPFSHWHGRTLTFSLTQCPTEGCSRGHSLCGCIEGCN